MKNFLLLFTFLATITLPLDAEIKKQVLFHDSSSPEFYDQSWLNIKAPSSISLPTGKTDKFPISTQIKKDGDNAIELTWTSKPNGEWKALVAGLNWDMFRMGGVSELRFWIYAPKAFDVEYLPDINMEGHYGGQCGKLKLSNYIHSISPEKWIQIRIPINDFRTVSKDFEGFNSIKGVFFHQSATDGNTHTLYLDEFEFIPISTTPVFNNDKLVGLWTFDNLDNLFMATKGSDIEPHGNWSKTGGYTETDQAIEIPQGTKNYLKVSHTIYPNGTNDGQFERVNSYAMLYDIMVENASQWHCLFQTDTNNDVDGTIFINPDGKIGCGTTHYTNNRVIQNNTWTRILINASLAGDKTIYEFWVDGEKVLTTACKIAPDNNRFSLGKEFLFFADDNGDDGDINVAELVLFNRHLDDSEIKAIGGISQELPDFSQDNRVDGYWNFDDKNDLNQAQKGNNLTLNSMQGEEVLQKAVDGPEVGNGAMQIGVGSFLICTHNISPNGPNLPISRVNEYCMMYDIKYTDISKSRSIFQSDPNNQKDGSLFVRSDGAIGLAGTIGYSDGGYIEKDIWNRIVINVRLGKSENCFFSVYLNGNLIFEGDKPEIDNPNMSLKDVFLLFADDNEENGYVAISQFALFNTWLTDTEIRELGGFIKEKETEMLPYLQAPTPHSIVINWHTMEKENMPTVVYGTRKDNLNNTISGSNEMVGDHIWNTVKLTGLEPDTEYFYQCKSGPYQSDICAFRTPMEGKASKVRLILVSDSQDNDKVTAQMVKRFTEMLKVKYGKDLHNHINLICHTGDMVSGGGVIDQYENRFFRPFSPLTNAIPVATTPGNHEVESKFYYGYVKYDDFANGISGVNPESFYTLNINGVQILMLNSNTPLRLQSQLDWLKTQLDNSKDDNNTVFSLGFCHHVFYSELWPGGSGAGLTEDTYQGTPFVGKIIDILKKYPKVQSLITGHVHGYERHVLPGENSSGRDFLEIVLGGAGGNLDRWGSNSTGPDIYEVKKSLDHYHFALLELDLERNSFEGNMYSFGNPDKPLDCIIEDTWYGKLNQDAPQTPSIEAYATDIVTVSDYHGTDSLMTIEIQIDEKNGNFGSPVYSKKIDAINIYGVDNKFNPVNINAGVNLKNIDISPAGLSNEKSYLIRVRFRDYNLKWSDWSETYQIPVFTSTKTDTNKNVRAFQKEKILHVQLPATLSGQVQIALHDISSKCIFNKKIEGMASNQDIPLSIENLPNGIYFLSVFFDNQEEHLKLLLQ